MRYLVKTPWWLKLLYPKRVWSKRVEEKVLYLSFDDGPHPVATNFVLDELKRYHGKASFFCIGKNVVAHPGTYHRILEEGHRTGNHTQHHLNGWKTSDTEYLNDIAIASQSISSNLFRPPYGRLKSRQAKKVKTAMNDNTASIVMWDVLSGDFDPTITNEKCLGNVTGNAEPGSIIVFHDSEKAFSRLQYVLPRVLQYFSEKGYLFEKL